MANGWFLKPKWLLFVPLLAVLVLAIACGDEGTPIVIEKEVIVEKEVIKEIPVEKQVIVEKEVIKEVPKIQIVEKEVIVEVPVEKQVVVEKEVIKEVIKEVPVEVVKEIEVEKEVVVVEQVIVTPTPQPRLQYLSPVWVKNGKYGGSPDFAAAGSNPGAIDLHYSSSFTSGLGVHGARFNNLVMFNPVDSSEVIGDLAVGWDVSSDGRTYTFYLAPNANWHDGKPVTAEDIRFSINRIGDLTANRPRAGAAVRPFYTPGNSRAIDEKTFEMTLKFASAGFIPWMAFDYAKMYPKHIVEKLTQDEMNSCYECYFGSGAWKFVELKRDSHIMWEKNTDYFKDGLPFWDGYTQFIIKDDARRLASLTTEQVLGTMYNSSTPSLSSFLQVQEDTGGRVLATTLPKASIGGLQLNHLKPPFDDVRARRAVMLGLDRVEIAKTVYKAEPWQSTFFPPGASDRGTDWYDANMPGWRYVDSAGNIVVDPVRVAGVVKHPDDIAEAKQLLIDAGAVGAKIEVRTGSPAGSVNAQVAVLIERQMDALGFDADAVLTDIAAYHIEVNKGNFSLVINSTWLEESDANSVLFQYYNPGGGRNTLGWSDPVILDGTEAQLRAATPADRKTIVMAMEDYLMKGESHFVPLHLASLQGALNVKIRNYHDRTPGGASVSSNSSYYQEHLWLDNDATAADGLGAGHTLVPLK